MIRLSLGVAAVIALAAASNAQAAESPEVLDAQCMMRASVAEAQLPPQGKVVANNMVFYYMGRMIGRNPKVDIAQQGKAALVALSKDKSLVIAKRCDKELQAIMGTFQKDAVAINAKP